MLTSFTTRAALAAVVATAGLTATTFTAGGTAQAATIPACNSATTFDHQTMPGVNGRRVACYIPYGAHGPVVKVLQQYLNHTPAINSRPGGPYLLAVDGQYGPATRRAVIAFQKSWNTCHCAASTQAAQTLAVDGSWGPRTSFAAQNMYQVCGC